MKEILIESLNYANILPTGLLIFVLIYWAIVLMGLLDINSLDVDVDVDADVDIDLDTDVDIDTDVDVDTDSGLSASDSISWFNNVLIFFNLQHVPLMVFFTFWFLPTWLITINLNHYFGNEGFVISLAFYLPALLVSLFLAKFLTIPIARIFKKMSTDMEITNPIGKLAEVRLPIKNNKMGQATIHDLNGNVVSINIISQKNQEISKGSQVLILEYLEKERAFMVETYN